MSIFPEIINIKVIDSDTHKPVSNVAIMLTLFANRKNDYHLIPPLSDEYGKTEISRKWLEKEIFQEKSLSIMDYSSDLDDCKSVIELKILDEDAVSRAVKAQKAYQEALTISQEWIDNLSRVSNYQYIASTKSVDVGILSSNEIVIFTKKRKITSPVFTPGKIGSLTLRNRIIRSGCFEGLSPNASPSEALIEHHRKVAAGGVGMTTVSYCAVARDGVAFSNEMWMREEIVPGLSRLTEAVHKEGAAASIQLGHCGFFANKSAACVRPMGPSRKFCLFRYSISRAMTEADMARIREDFARSAGMAIKAGFDAIEIHAGHGYLLSQFLSPWTNMRKDQYGGSLENRLRFPVSVIRAVREKVGPEYPVLVKMNVEDGFKGGLTFDEAVEAAKAYEAAGASALVPSCGFTARTSFYMMRGQVPILEYVKSEKNPVTKIGMALFGRFIVKEVPYKELFLLEQARRIKDAVKILVIYIGGVCSLANMEIVMKEGFPFIQVGRMTVRDPGVINKMAAGEAEGADCDHCNRCVAEMAVKGIGCTSEIKGMKRKEYKG